MCPDIRALLDESAHPVIGHTTRFNDVEPCRHAVAVIEDTRRAIVMLKRTRLWKPLRTLTADRREQYYIDDPHGLMIYSQGCRERTGGVFSYVLYEYDECPPMITCWMNCVAILKVRPDKSSDTPLFEAALCIAPV